MNQDLIERYIYAATRQLPRKQQEDVAQELRGLIDDMLTERCGVVTPTEKDIRVVLTELGTPQELAAQYDTDAKKCLIGQPYYSTYKFVLKIVLLAVAGGITIANVMLQLFEPREWFVAVTEWLSQVYNCLLAGFAIVTLIFAYFHHKGIQITKAFRFDDLPPVPRRSQKIPKWECIMEIVVSVIFVVVLLAVPQALGFSVSMNGQSIRVMNVSGFQDSWYIIAALACCSIVNASVQLLEGQYNKRVLIVAAVTNGISAILSVAWLTGFELFHPEFLTFFASLVEGESAVIVSLFSNLQRFFLFIALFAQILDSANVAVKTLRK